MIYLGDMRWKWLPLATLLPFQKHRQEKVAEADSLAAAKRFTKPILFHKALKVTTRILYVWTARRACWKWVLRCHQAVQGECYAHLVNMMKSSSCR